MSLYTMPNLEVLGKAGELLKRVYEQLDISFSYDTLVNGFNNARKLVPKKHAELFDHFNPQSVLTKAFILTARDRYTHSTLTQVVHSLAENSSIPQIVIAQAVGENLNLPHPIYQALEMGYLFEWERLHGQQEVKLGQGELMHVKTLYGASQRYRKALKKLGVLLVNSSL